MKSSEALKFIAELSMGREGATPTEAMQMATEFITACRRKAGEALPAALDLERRHDHALRVLEMARKILSGDRDQPGRERVLRLVDELLEMGPKDGAA